MKKNVTYQPIDVWCQVRDLSASRGNLKRHLSSFKSISLINNFLPLCHRYRISLTIDCWKPGGYTEERSTYSFAFFFKFLLLASYLPDEMKQL